LPASSNASSSKSSKRAKALIHASAFARFEDLLEEALLG